MAKNKDNNCYIPGEDSTAAQIVASKKLELEKVLNEYLKEDWGIPFGNEADIAESRIAKFKTRLSDLNTELKKEPRVRKRKKLRKQINSLKTKIRTESQVKKDAADKLKVTTELIDMLRNRFDEAIRLSNYDFDVRKSGDVLKWFLTKRLKTGFKTVTDLPYLDIREIKNTLQGWFDAQDESIKNGNLGKYKGLGKTNWYVKDPAYVVIANDNSFKAMTLEKAILQNTDKKSTDKVKYKDRYELNRVALNQFIYKNDIKYFPDPNNQPADINSLIVEERADNIKNIYDLEADILRGRTKYIKPMSLEPLVYDYKKDKNVQEIVKKYNQIISYANDSGFHISKDIHSQPGGGDTVYYYVTLKNVDKNGVETYDAYLAPHYKDKNNRVRFYYPLTKDNKQNGSWNRAAKSSMKAKEDIADVMTEGFREAQSEKVFTGYNKNNDEISTKGYADYKKIDLNLEHPLFNRGRIFPGTSQTKTVSLFDSIKEVRKILADVFQDNQLSSVKTYKRLQKSMAKLASLKTNLMKQHNLTEEAADNHIARLKDMINLDDVLYEDKNGDVKIVSTRNINLTKGIKDNYYPAMYTDNNNLVDRLKFLQFAEGEMERIQDQIQQKQVLAKNETDRVKKNGIFKELIRLKKRLLVYEGDKENDIPGLYELELSRLEAMLHIIEPEDVIKVPTQQMGNYVKHRKLYTNTLKDPNPEIEFGGARTDANVIPDYIDSMIENKYSNELNALAIDVIPSVNPAIGNYLIEEVKTALGRFDVAAGFYFDYSNKRTLELIRKVFPGYSSQRLQEMTSNINTLISAASLGIKASAKNNLQSIMGNMTLLGYQTESQVMTLLDNPVLVEEIVSKTGVTDTVQAVADIWVSGIGGSIDLADGFHSKKDILLFKLAKTKFVKKNKRLYNYIMEKVKDRDYAQGDLQTVVESMMKGTWEFVNGLAKGQVSDKWMKAIESKMYGEITKGQIRIYANWGLNAFGIDQSIAETKGIVPYISMVQGERRMRKLEALRHVVFYCDFVRPELKGQYTHPDAIEHARKGVASTMFQFSMEHYSKMMRGSVGASLWKFKPYFFAQGHQEAEYFMNFYNRIKGLPPKRQIAEMKKVFAPTNDAFYGRLLGVSGEDIQSSRIMKGIFPWMRKENHESGPLTGSALILNRYFHGRLMASFWTVMMEKTTAGKIFRKFTKRVGIGDVNSYAPGAESVLATPAFRVLQLGLIAANFASREEDDKWYEWTQLTRIFFPLWLNVSLEMYLRKEYLSPGRLFGSWTWFGLKELFDSQGWTKD